jgi:hypothetical protein
MQVTVGLGMADTPTVIGGRIARGGMLHHFSVEVVDTTGRRSPGSSTWAVTLLAGGSTERLETLARLDALTPDVQLPRPLGYELSQADSVVVAVRSTSGARGESLVVSIDCEPLDGPVTQLAVRPMIQSDEPAMPASGAQSWEWRADTTGRLLAVIGLPLAHATSLVVEDAATGEPLWHAAVGTQGTATVFGQPSPVVRLGLPVQAGRVYRLTLAYTPGAAATPAAVVAMVLPRQAER